MGIAYSLHHAHLHVVSQLGGKPFGRNDQLSLIEIHGDRTARTFDLTAAYLGLGYGIGSDWQAATSFLTNLSVLVLSLAALLVAGVVASGRTPKAIENN